MVSEKSEGMQRTIVLIQEIYKLVDELQALFPCRKFTPDGHMVGSFGEVWAQWMYDLDLLPNSAEGHNISKDFLLRVGAAKAYWSSSFIRIEKRSKC